MKKKIALLLLSLLIVFFLYALLFIRVEQQQIRINLSYLKINQQISSVRNIAKWYLPFSATDTSSIRIAGNNRLESNNSTLTITQLTGLRAMYKLSEGGQTRVIIFDLDPLNADSTIVTLKYETTIWNKFFTQNSIIFNAQKSLENLKDYFDDTKKMYGYEIEKAEVTDTAFLFRSAIIPNAKKRATFKELFESMIQYAKEKDLGYNGTRIFYFIPFGNDSIHLFTSIGITNTEKSKFNDKFLLKQMPYKGRLLSAYYQGSIGNISRVINALEQYRTDNVMTSMAIPFVKLITEGVDFDDSQIIQAKGQYPVY